MIAYINIGAYWSNIELAAEAAGLDGDWSAQVIAWSVLLSFVGCFAAMWILKRFDHDRPLLFTFCLMVIAVGLLAVDITAALFVFSVAMFNFLWIFIDVYQMGGVSVADRSGSAAAFIPGAQGLGQTVGPFCRIDHARAGWGFRWRLRLCAPLRRLRLRRIYIRIYLKYRQQLSDAAPSKAALANDPIALPTLRLLASGDWLTLLDIGCQAPSERRCPPTPHTQSAMPCALWRF